MSLRLRRIRVLTVPSGSPVRPAMAEWLHPSTKARRTRCACRASSRPITSRNSSASACSAGVGAVDDAPANIASERSEDAAIRAACRVLRRT